jgi:hypothetical protein
MVGLLASNEMEKMVIEVVLSEFGVLSTKTSAGITVLLTVI